MKKSTKKFIVLCCTIIALVLWNGIYMDYLFPGNFRCQPDCSLKNIIMFIPLGIKEELIFRYLPLILSTCIYVSMKKLGNKWAKISLISLSFFVFCVQFTFSSLHIPLDPIYRGIVYHLPPYPTLEELFNTFLLQGVLGLSLCLCYIIYIPKEKPLSLFQGKSLLASCFVHIVYNQLVVIIY